MTKNFLNKFFILTIFFFILISCQKENIKREKIHVDSSKLPNTYTATPGVIQSSIVPSFYPQITSTPTTTSQITSLPTQTSTQNTPQTTTKPTDKSIPDSTSVRVHIYDEDNKPLEINVTGRILVNDIFFSNGNNTITTSSETNDLFSTSVFWNAPTYTQIEYTAHKYGMTTRKLIFSAVSNIEFNVNDIYFGVQKSIPSSIPVGGKKYFVSNRPEATPLIPIYNSTNVTLNTPLKMRFSETIDKESVEKNLVIKIKEPGNTSLKVGDIVLTGADYNTKWNSDDTEVTFTPKSSKLLITSKTPPKYSIEFKELFKDKAGNLSNNIQGHFRVEPDNYMESIFTVVSENEETK